MHMCEPLITKRELAERLRSSPSTLSDWRRDNRGPKSFIVAGKVVYKQSDVERWLDKQRTVSA